MEAHSLGGPSPLGQHFGELAQLAINNLTKAIATGAWRTAIYLLGDWEGGPSYGRLSSVWNSIFGGHDSVLDPVRCYPLEEARRWAAKWAMPDLKSRSSHHPYAYQTLLTSAQLATYIHPPNLETSGFTIRAIPDFDVSVPRTNEGERFTLGPVLHREKPTQLPYAFPLAALTKHAFISGVTGGGKTNTILHLLKQAASEGVPFLILEPAKTEYRALLKDEKLKHSLRIYTLGREILSPFRLNPFEVPTGIPVATHLDLLRSAFATGFGMWSPLPQILEQCLYRIYEDAGWNLTTGKNARLAEGEENSSAFPTLSDLVEKVDGVTRSLGYDEKITLDLKAALLTRLDSLRTGGKGSMLDCQASFNWEDLLRFPTILEMEGLGDEDDKALLMSLLLIRLVEQRRVKGMQTGLRHLLVIEEAHRLLANPAGGRRQEEGDPRGKAVETFANLLAEIRAYGQGVIIADQVPVKLAPDVIKNTNLKIAHRIVSEDDRKVLAGAMAMNERQTRSLATLAAGEAVVFREGEDAPVLVKVVNVKGAPKQHPTDLDVKRHQQTLNAGASKQLEPRPNNAYAYLTDRIVKMESFRRLFSRFVLTTIENPASASVLFSHLVAFIRSLRQVNERESVLIDGTLTSAAHWLSNYRGRQNQWSYADTNRFAKALAELLSELAINQQTAVFSKAALAFQQVALSLHQRVYEPYQRCASICSHQTTCLYRHWVADAISRRNDEEDWTQEEAWKVSLDVSYNVLDEWEDASEANVMPFERSNAAQRRVALCFLQQTLATDTRYLPVYRGVLLDQFIQKVNLEVSHEG